MFLSKNGILTLKHSINIKKKFQYLRIIEIKWLKSIGDASLLKSLNSEQISRLQFSPSSYVCDLVEVEQM